LLTKAKVRRERFRSVSRESISRKECVRIHRRALVAAGARRGCRPALESAWHLAPHIGGRRARFSGCDLITGARLLLLSGRAADLAIGVVTRQWSEIAARKRRAPHPSDALAWMETDPYVALARRWMEEKVRAPLVARGIPVAPADGSASPAYSARPLGGLSEPSPARWASGRRFLCHCTDLTSALVFRVGRATSARSALPACGCRGDRRNCSAP